MRELNDDRPVWSDPHLVISRTPEKEVDGMKTKNRRSISPRNKCARFD